MTMRNVLVAAAVLGIAQGLFAAAPAEAAPKVCKLEIAANDMIQFDKKELKVAGDCTEVELVLKHTGKLPAAAMGHNWVLTKSADASAVAAAGQTASKTDYLVPNDKRVIAHTRLIGGGQTASVKFAASKLKKGEAYTFQCTFPGHSAIMKGKLVFG